MAPAPAPCATASEFALESDGAPWPRLRIPGLVSGESSADRASASLVPLLAPPIAAMKGRPTAVRVQCQA